MNFIEHNPLIINQADYIIEIGPEGGELGGYVVKEGWLESNSAIHVKNYCAC